jgi:hypothetical protein
MKIMKIFPLRFMSNFDILIDLCKAIPSQKTPKIVSEPDTAIINGMVKTLKKGRNICDKLSE